MGFPQGPRSGDDAPASTPGSAQGANNCLLQVPKTQTGDHHAALSDSHNRPSPGCLIPANGCGAIHPTMEITEQTSLSWPRLLPVDVGRGVHDPLGHIPLNSCTRRTPQKSVFKGYTSSIYVIWVKAPAIGNGCAVSVASAPSAP